MGMKGVPMLNLQDKLRLTSQELCELYGVAHDYRHAARTAHKLVRDYNLPYVRIGYRWVKL